MTQTLTGVRRDEHYPWNRAEQCVFWAAKLKGKMQAGVYTIRGLLEDDGGQRLTGTGSLCPACKDGTGIKTTVMSVDFDGFIR